jgi:hypothetical protein
VTEFFSLGHFDLDLSHFGSVLGHRLIMSRVNRPCHSTALLCDHGMTTNFFISITTIIFLLVTSFLNKEDQLPATSHTYTGVASVRTLAPSGRPCLLR